MIKNLFNSDKKSSDKKSASDKSQSQEQQNGAVAKSEAEKQQTTVSSPDSGASSFDPPFWVAAMYKSSDDGDETTEVKTSSQTFATDNLMPTITKYRRRPGGSLNKFKTMAKESKTSQR
ncbi:MAG: hypothetical protein AAFQ80_04610 [Cyanobacteria bacterium J06621_8]